VSSISAEALRFQKPTSRSIARLVFHLEGRAKFGSMKATCMAGVLPTVDWLSGLLDTIGAWVAEPLVGLVPADQVLKFMPVLE
jgi:hypothetical protein